MKKIILMFFVFNLQYAYSAVKIYQCSCPQGSMNSHLSLDSTCQYMTSGYFSTLKTVPCKYLGNLSTTDDIDTKVTEMSSAVDRKIDEKLSSAIQTIMREIESKIQNSASSTILAAKSDAASMLSSALAAQNDKMANDIKTAVNEKEIVLRDLIKSTTAGVKQAVIAQLTDAINTSSFETKDEINRTTDGKIASQAIATEQKVLAKIDQKLSASIDQFKTLSSEGKNELLVAINNLPQSVLVDEIIVSLKDTIKQELLKEMK